MPEFSTEFWLMLLTYGVSFGMFYGGVMQRLKTLESKMEKHNTVVERTYKLENDMRTTFTKLDNLREELHSK